jgi:hypothetical protein
MVNPRKLYLSVNSLLGTNRVRHRTKKGRNWMLFPLIVPPVYEKHQLIRTHLHGVWANAEAALLAARRVVFWGYSFIHFRDAHSYLATDL